MVIRDLMEAAEVLLFFGLIGSLVLSAFIFFFVFCIDWVDWFFSIRLEGPLAGIYLFLKMAGAVAIICLMAHYPRYRRQSVLLVFGYYTFLFIDAVVTLQKHPQGSRDYPYMMMVLFFLSVLLLIVHGTLALTGTREHNDTET